jgi:hypothetical protein
MPSAAPAPVAYTSTGKFSLNQLAGAHGMSVHQLINSSLASQSNPGLTKYIAAGNYNLPVPSGVQFLIPRATWKG